MSMEIMLTSSNAAAEIKLKEAAAGAASTDIAVAEATTNVVTKEVVADTAVTNTTTNEAVVIDGATSEAAVVEEVTADGVAEGEVAVDVNMDEVTVDSEVTTEIVTDGVMVDEMITTGEGVMGDDSYIDPAFAEEGMYVDPGMGQIKDPLLSSWPFVIGISLAVLFVSIALGAFLARRKIKKGIELYED